MSLIFPPPIRRCPCFHLPPSLHLSRQESENLHVKTIANMAFTTRIDTPHNALYTPGYHAGGGSFSWPACLSTADASVPL